MSLVQGAAQPHTSTAVGSIPTPLSLCVELKNMWIGDSEWPVRGECVSATSLRLVTPLCIMGKAPGSAPPCTGYDKGGSLLACREHGL